MKNKLIILCLLFVVLTFSSCSSNPKGIDIYKKSVNAFNNLESATVVMNCVNKIEEESISKVDITKFNFINKKRVSYTESYMADSPETVSKTYIDHKNKKYYETNYYGLYQTLDVSRLSSLALNNSKDIYWAEINEKNIVKENVVKDENGYTVEFELNKDSLKKYMESFGMGDVPLASIKLTLKTNLDFVPQSIDCSYLRINEVDNEFSEIEVIDTIEFKDINTTEKLTEPKL